MDSSPHLELVVCALARYLRDNPHASDSAAGICRWWFPDGYAVTADELDKALTWMKQRELVDEVVGADGRIRFRRRGTDAQLDAVAQAAQRRHRGDAMTPRVRD